MTNGNETAGPAAADQALSMSLGSTSQEFTPNTMEDSFQEDEEIDSETDRVAKSFGVLHFQNQKSMYIGEAHWAAILSDVS